MQYELKLIFKIDNINWPDLDWAMDPMVRIHPIISVGPNVGAGAELDQWPESVMASCPKFS